jgi:hypothetical protein
LIISSQFLSTSAEAEITQASYELAITKAAEKIDRGDYQGAIYDLEELLRIKPDDENATLYLAIAMSRSDNIQAEHMLKKALAINPQNPRTNLETGIYYYNRAFFSEAADFFETTIQLAPDTALSTSAREYLNNIKQGDSKKRWSLYFSLGGQYDSNVVLDSDDVSLPEGISDKSDWRAIIFLSGRYSILSSDTYPTSVGYSFYQSLHADLDDFNVTDHLFDLKTAIRLSPIFTLNALYAFEHISAGGDTYNYTHLLSPSLTISEPRGFSTEIRYEFRDNHFKDSDLFEDNSDRTGSNNLIGIIQNIPLGPVIRAELGYSFDLDSTREDYWDYSGHKGTLEVLFSLPYDVYLTLYGEYYSKDYDDEYPDTNKKRDDDFSVISLSATKIFSETYSLTIGQYFSNNDSNISEFEYDRAISTLLFNMSF